MASAPNHLRVAGLTPATRINASDLPPEISGSLSTLQRDGLAFASRTTKVTSARVQSFHIGSKSKGNVNLIGADRAVGQYWGIFGATGSINQHSVNEFRTDIQIKLEDASGQRYFLNYCLPFAITLAVDPGDALEIFFVKGGLKNRFAQSDYRCDEWVAFAARNVETRQFLPISFLPSLSPPRPNWLFAGIVVGVIGLIFLVNQEFIASLWLLPLSAIFIVTYVFKKQSYLKDYRSSREKSAVAIV